MTVINKYFNSETLLIEHSHLLKIYIIEFSHNMFYFSAFYSFIMTDDKVSSRYIIDININIYYRDNFVYI